MHPSPRCSQTKAIPILNLTLALIPAICITAGLSSSTSLPLAAPTMAQESYQTEEEKIIVSLRRIRAKIHEAKKYGAAVRVYEAGADAIDSERIAGKPIDYLKSHTKELEANIDSELARIKRINPMPRPPKLVDAPSGKGKRLISPLLFPTKAEMKYLMQQVAGTAPSKPENSAPAHPKNQPNSSRAQIVSPSR